MKRFLKIPVEFETELTEEQLLEKVDDKIREQQEENLYAQKGRGLYLWERDNDSVSLKYYHSFKNDMCDTAFRGKTEKGLRGCRLEGFVKKPSGIWAVFWVIIGITLAIIGAFFTASLFADDPQLYLVPVFGLIVLGVAFVEVNLLMFDKKRLRDINDYLREFTSAKNVDVLGEDLEAEAEKRQQLINDEAENFGDSDNGESEN